jgi:hypothetical protein
MQSHGLYSRAPCSCLQAFRTLADALVKAGSSADARSSGGLNLSLDTWLSLFTGAAVSAAFAFILTVIIIVSCV